MSIDASVAYVECKEDGSGTLHLVSRDGSDRNIAGQPRLYFASAPYEVTALNGLNVWGGGTQLMLGEHQIARRDGYTRIVFVDDAAFREAVAAYHQKRQQVKEPTERTE